MQESNARAPGAPGNPMESSSFRRGGVCFIPPEQFQLVIPPRGLKKLVRRNLVEVWLEVFPAGLRAVVHGEFALGETLPARIEALELEVPIEVQLKVRRTRPAVTHPGCSRVSFRFIDPDPRLIACLRKSLCHHPVVRPDSRNRVL